MTRNESDFFALQALVESARSDPGNVGSYLLRAYWLGNGEATLDEILSPPAADKVAAVGLKLVR
jgi:hypothetical protein